MTTKTNVVYYKFNSTNTWRHIKQTAVITLNDLEKHISNYTQIGDCNHTNKEVSCSCQFRLSFYDSTRHKEINDRHRALDRNSHIVVKRYPMNKKNITRIEKKMVLKHEMEAKAASLKAIAKKKKIEDDKDEAKKKANVEARLKELEDERWERARIAHEREVAELKLELEKTNDKKRFLINSKSKKDKINCSSKTLSRKRHFKSHEDNVPRYTRKATDYQSRKKKRVRKFNEKPRFVTKTKQLQRFERFVPKDKIKISLH